MTRSGTVKRLALAVALTSLVAACSSGGATTAPSAAAPSAAAPSEAAPSAAAPSEAAAAKTYKDLTVGFIQTGSESGWRAANTASFKETATQLGINLKFYDAQNKLENQVSAFHQFNQDPSVNVIILAALDVTGYDDVLKEAQAAGKVVVLEDRRIDADPSLYATYIGSDFALEGQKAAKAMCDLLKDSSKKNVVEISGAVGASAAIDRAKGFREKHHRHPDRQLGRARVEGGHGGLPQEEHRHPGRVRAQRRRGDRRHPGHQGSRPRARQGHPGHRRGRHGQRLQGDDRRRAGRRHRVQPAARTAGV
jgi:ABC-type sugar transport system substrate-binding protein